jgi:predicted DNA-binding mobile mystery protein A
MVTPYEQLDKRFSKMRPFAQVARPSRGWIRAIREALGMTTGQLAKRLGVQQPRIIVLERGEVDGNITMKSLERAAEALGCRLVYALIPEKPLTDTIRKRASLMTKLQLASVEQTMRLEAQGVTDKAQHTEAHQRLVERLLRRPARLWDEQWADHLMIQMTRRHFFIPTGCGRKPQIGDRQVGPAAEPKLWTSWTPQ